MDKNEQIKKPINADFENISTNLLKPSANIEKQLIAMYRGKLPIGNIELDCAVLNNGQRILSAKSVFAAFDRPRRANSRLEINGIKIPAFMDAANLKDYINQEVIERITPINYLDGKQIKQGYSAHILTKMCEIYLMARRDNVLTPSQEKLAIQSEILLSAFANLGIDALIDEATGYQYDRKHDALRVLLVQYVAEGLKKWIHTFPDDFFAELDRLYGNEKTTSQNRPQYYGKFITKYIYEPIENGYVKKELDKLNIDKDGKRKARFHQWLTEHGRNILTYQIGRLQGKMEECTDINHFKTKQSKQKQISIAPYLFEEMNKVD
jgi:hypothetical protein